MVSNRLNLHPYIEALRTFWLDVTSLDEARAKGLQMVEALERIATQQRANAANAEASTREETARVSKTVRVGLHRALDAQLVYGNRTGKLSAEMPNISLAVYEAMVGRAARARPRLESASWFSKVHNLMKRKVLF